MTQTLKCPDLPKRGPGRPRSDATRCAIIQAAYELLEEGGMANFTIEGVAARSGSAKTTIYRWWPSRGVLAAEAMLSRLQSADPTLESGSPMQQLKQVMQNTADLFAGPAGRVVAALIAESQSCAGTADAIMQPVIVRRREKGKELVARAIASGELKRDIDVEATLDALFGPFFSRLMFGRVPFEPDYVERLYSTVLEGVAARPDITEKGTRSSR